MTTPGDRRPRLLDSPETVGLPEGDGSSVSPALPQTPTSVNGKLPPEGGAPDPDYFASIFPGPQQVVSKGLRDAVIELEKVLDLPVWLLIQPAGQRDFSQLGDSVRSGLFKARREMRSDGPIALVIDSPGGSAQVAYQIATMMGRRCEGFVAVIPRYAKSAATLLALGASEILMGQDAELGPLDAQLFDMDREDWASALDEVQALERLNVAALEQFDQVMMMLVQRTGKRLENLLPHALKYTSDTMRPLLERIDTVHYIRQSRVLKVAEDYAVRLLTPKYGEARSTLIASHFVNNFPEHAFVINREEAATMLDLIDPTPDLETAVDQLADVLAERSEPAVGRLTRESENSDGQN